MCTPNCNRCSLPRLCTTVGEGEYKKYNIELDKEKKEEEKIEQRIRQLRKERNKARIHPTREQGPSKKRRKIGEDEYISISEIWGQPQKREAVKSKRQEEEQEESNANIEKKIRIESATTPTKEKIEGDSTKGDIDEYKIDEDWNERFKQYREQVLREQEDRKERIEMKEKKEKSWQLYKLCKEYLEENSEDWRKRRIQREHDKNRIARLEKAGILSRKAKMEALEKNIEIGMRKLPEVEREKIHLEEEKKKRLEIKPRKNSK